MDLEIQASHRSTKTNKQQKYTDKKDDDSKKTNKSTTFAGAPGKKNASFGKKYIFQMK